MGRVEASVVRITHTDTSGFGKIATLKFILPLTTPSGEVYFSLSSAIKTDHVGHVTAIAPQTDSTLILPLTTSVSTQGTRTVVLYPNPSHDILRLHSNEVIGNITITNAVGQIVFQHFSSQKTLNINVNTFDPGVYVIHMQGTYVKFIRN